MPIRKFRSVDEMNQPVRREAGDPQLYRAIRALWNLARRTSQKGFMPGVRRFRSIEEMSRDSTDR